MFRVLRRRVKRMKLATVAVAGLTGRFGNTVVRPQGWGQTACMDAREPVSAADLIVALDYGQFYLSDGTWLEDFPDLVDRALSGSGIVASRGTVVVISPHQNNFKMPFRVEVHTAQPVDDIAKWDEVCEVHIDVGPGGLFFESPTLTPVLLPVSEGSYHALISGRGFVAHGWPGTTTPGDRWRLQTLAEHRAQRGPPTQAPRGRRRHPGPENRVGNGCRRGRARLGPHQRRPRPRRPGGVLPPAGRGSDVDPVATRDHHRSVPGRPRLRSRRGDHGGDYPGPHQQPLHQRAPQHPGSKRTALRTASQPCGAGCVVDAKFSHYESPLPETPDDLPCVSWTRIFKYLCG